MTDSIPLVAFALKPFSTGCRRLSSTWAVAVPLLHAAGRVRRVADVAVDTPRMAAGHRRGILRHGAGAVDSDRSSIALRALAAALGAGNGRTPTADVRCARIKWAALGLVAGLICIHDLAVMVLALLTAVVVRPSATAWPRKAASLAGAAGATIAGWWAAGLFSVSGAEAMATEGLGHYSMNLFSPITQAGGRSSSSFRAPPRGQDFEGFQYRWVACCC